MFRSLRWRLIGAFSLVILLTTVLSAALSIWATTSRFDILVTDESRQQAQAIAPLLEASYAYRGNWSDLNDLLSGGNPELISPLEMFIAPWISDIDWVELAARTLKIDEETLFDQLADRGNLATVAESYDVDPDALVQVIIKAERAAVEEAVTIGKIRPNEVSRIMVEVEAEARTFVWEETFFDLETLDWEAIITNELGMSEDEFYESLEHSAIVELAIERGIDPQQLVDTIVAAEETAAQANGEVLDETFEQELIEAVEFWIYEDLPPDYIFGFQEDDSEITLTDEGISWLLGTILMSNGLLLIANPKGEVVYDSAAARINEHLDTATLAKGVPLWDYIQDAPLGTVIVAADPGYLNAHQAAFLRGVSWSLVAGSLIATVVALLVGLVVAKRVLTPVAALTEATRRLANGEQATPLPVHSNDELGQMSDNFNKMAQALEEQKRLRNRLVDDVAHEIKTPLSIVKLELKAAIDGIQTPEETAERVQHEIDLLQNLMEDLSWLTESDQGTMQLLDPEPTDLVQLTTKAVDRWRSKAKATGIDLQIMPVDPLPSVNVDPIRISQVLSNLIVNALQHTPSGGQVKIRLFQESRPSSSETSSTLNLVTTISDTGPGIASADLPHIFDRFYRADRSRNRRTGGRGLGLAIVRQIIELHSGQVWVESRVGQGTTFGYSLPL